MFAIASSVTLGIQYLSQALSLARYFMFAIASSVTLGIQYVSQALSLARYFMFAIASSVQLIEISYTWACSWS